MSRRPRHGSITDPIRIQAVRLRPLDPIQQQQMILTYVQSYGSITRSQTMELCRVSATQARSLLKSMVQTGDLVLQGECRGAHYRLPTPR